MVQPHDNSLPTAETGGDVELHSADASSPYRETDVVLSFEGITVKSDNGAVILSGVSGVITPGLTAIMGPTGSGKTTLLNQLVSFSPVGLERVSGTTLINGKPFTPQQVHFGYCLQTDDLNGHLTVYETLRYAADLVLAHSTAEQRDARVMELLDELGLKHKKDVLVGTQTKRGISGGQRKRVSIALAMLASPPLLLLDEPTAGLDSVTAMMLINLLKRLAIKDRLTILCVIHQPQRKIFEQLDRLLIVRSAEIIYDGPAQGCVGHMTALGYVYDGVSNPADYIMEVTSPQLGETYKQLEGRCLVRRSYRKPLLAEHDLNPTAPLPQSHEMPTRLHQLTVLMRRQFSQELRDVNLHLLNLSATLICAFLIGGVWFQLGNSNASLTFRNPVLFFVCINQSLFGAMKSILHFPDQRRTMLRERRAKLYSTSPAFLSWSIVDILMVAPWAALFSVITYFMIGLRTDSARHFFLYFFVMFLDKVTASSIAVMICTWTSQVSIPTVVLPVVLELSRLFGGFFLPPSLLPSYFKWLDPLSYVKYAYLAVANNELQGLELCSPSGVCNTSAADAVIQQRYLDYMETGPCIGVLIAFVVFTRFVAYLFLLFKKV